MSSRKIRIVYAIFCILASAVYTAEAGATTTTTTEENGEKKTVTEYEGLGTETRTETSTGSHTRLEVQHYYETICPAARQAFKEMFKPNYEQFLDYIEFTFVPYGFAETTADGTIKCQFGEDECLGNKYQACALKLGQSEKERLEYCVCVMTTDRVEAYTGCGKGMGNFAEIETCAKGEDGIKYLKEMGDITHQLQPPLDNVPAMYIEGKALSEEEKNCMWNDFVLFFCAKLPSAKPKCCEGKETKPNPEGSPSPSSPAPH